MPLVSREGNQGPRVVKGLTQAQKAASQGARPGTQVSASGSLSCTPERSPYSGRSLTKAVVIVYFLVAFSSHLSLLHLWKAPPPRRP